MDKDKITTIVGAIGAAALAAEPVMNSVSGSLHSGDYFNLFSAIAFAVLGWFSNKNK
jgi:hypothetical protein